MPNHTGLSPHSPTKYTGATTYLVPVVTRNREPTGADYIQPETGKLYPFNTFWLISKNPTNGTQGDLWYLSKIVANVGYWIKLSSGAGQIISISGNDGLEIFPDSEGNIQLLGTVATNDGTIPQPVYTHKQADSIEDITLLYSVALASANANKVGLSNFLNSQFTVDNTTGFVELIGGSTPALQKIHVDANTAPGTDPVIPNAAGLVTIEGGVTYNTGTRTKPIRTNSLAANTLDLEIQLAGSNAATADTMKFGVAQFDANQFTVTNGYVKITNFSPFSYLQISANYTVDTTSSPNYYLSCDSSGGAFTIKLLDAPTLLYRRFIIKDRTGNASTKNITISSQTGAVLIDGATSYIMAGNFDSIELIWNGTSYEVY